MSDKNADPRSSREIQLEEALLALCRRADHIRQLPPFDRHREGLKSAWSEVREFALGVLRRDDVVSIPDGTAESSIENKGGI